MPGIHLHVYDEYQPSLIFSLTNAVKMQYCLKLLTIGFESVDESQNSKKESEVKQILIQGKGIKNWYPANMVYFCFAMLTQYELYTYLLSITFRTSAPVIALHK